MQGWQRRVADQLFIKGQDGGQLVAAPVELDTKVLDIGHTRQQRPERAVAAVLDHLHGFGFDAGHFAPLGRSSVKAPVAAATGRVSSSSVAVTRTKATERVT